MDFIRHNLLIRDFNCWIQIANMKVLKKMDMLDSTVSNALITLSYTNNHNPAPNIF